VVVACVGLLVTALGLATRVTSLETSADGVRIRYALRHPFSALWGDVRGLHPPSSIVGAWALSAIRGGCRRTCRLMASDLLGHEEFLDRVVAGASLRFERGRWV
jgi:hypothetical protein